MPRDLGTAQFNNNRAQDIMLKNIRTLRRSLKLTRPPVRSSHYLIRRNLSDQPPRPRNNPDGNNKASSSSSSSSSSPAGPVKVDSTVFFRLTNPELFLDVNSSRTWYLVGFVWLAFGSSYGYLSYQESQEQEVAEAKESMRLRLEKEQQVIINRFGPQRPPTNAT